MYLLFLAMRKCLQVFLNSPEKNWKRNQIDDLNNSRIYKKHYTSRLLQKIKTRNQYFLLIIKEKNDTKPNAPI